MGDDGDDDDDDGLFVCRSKRGKGVQVIVVARRKKRDVAWRGNMAAC